MLKKMCHELSILCSKNHGEITFRRSAEPPTRLIKLTTDSNRCSSRLSRKKVWKGEKQTYMAGAERVTLSLQDPFIDHIC